jgi:hypothetical protein
MSPPSQSGASATSKDGHFDEMQRLRLPHAAARAVDVAGLVGDILSGELEIMEASWAG